MNLSDHINLFFSARIYNAIDAGLYHGKVIEPKSVAAREHALLLFGGAERTVLPNGQGNPIPCYRVTMTVADAIQLGWLLNRIAWPHNHADYSIVATATQIIFTALESWRDAAAMSVPT
jgi:hypothetical protein